MFGLFAESEIVSAAVVVVAFDPTHILMESRNKVEKRHFEPHLVYGMLVSLVCVCGCVNWSDFGTGENICQQHSLSILLHLVFVVCSFDFFCSLPFKSDFSLLI